MSGKKRTYIWALRFDKDRSSFWLYEPSVADNDRPALVTFVTKDAAKRFLKAHNYIPGWKPVKVRSGEIPGDAGCGALKFVLWIAAAVWLVSIAYQLAGGKI